MQLTSLTGKKKISTILNVLLVNDMIQTHWARCDGWLYVPSWLGYGARLLGQTLDVAVNKFCRCDELWQSIDWVKEITLSNTKGLHALEGLKRKMLRLPGEEGILPQDSNIEISPEFRAGPPTLRIWDLSAPTNVWVNSLKSISVSLSIYIYVDILLFLVLQITLTDNSQKNVTRIK